MPSLKGGPALIVWYRKIKLDCTHAPVKQYAKSSWVADKRL